MVDSLPVGVIFIGVVGTLIKLISNVLSIDDTYFPSVDWQLRFISCSFTELKFQLNTVVFVRVELIRCHSLSYKAWTLYVKLFPTGELLPLQLIGIVLDSL